MTTLNALHSVIVGLGLLAFTSCVNEVQVKPVVAHKNLIPTVEQILHEVDDVIDGRSGFTPLVRCARGVVRGAQGVRCTGVALQSGEAITMPAGTYYVENTYEQTGLDLMGFYQRGWHVSFNVFCLGWSKIMYHHDTHTVSCEPQSRQEPPLP